MKKIFFLISSFIVFFSCGGDNNAVLVNDNMYTLYDLGYFVSPEDSMYNTIVIIDSTVYRNSSSTEIKVQWGEIPGGIMDTAQFISPNGTYLNYYVPSSFEIRTPRRIADNTITDYEFGRWKYLDPEKEVRPSEFTGSGKAEMTLLPGKQLVVYHTLKFENLTASYVAVFLGNKNGGDTIAVQGKWHGSFCYDETIEVTESDIVIEVPDTLKPPVEERKELLFR